MEAFGIGVLFRDYRGGMTTTSEASHAATPSVNGLAPEWIRVPQACYRFSVSKSKLYELIASGHIESISLREEGVARGTRLIRCQSVRDYYEKLAAEQNGMTRP